ncbi:hypothetical protein Ancab_022305 [Ancistrocladus abbreviatus]
MGALFHLSVVSLSSPLRPHRFPSRIQPSIGSTLGPKFSSAQNCNSIATTNTFSSRTPTRAIESDESRFMDENGVIDDMDGYLNHLSLEYDSVWDTKPSWCQPWTIILTGASMIACSWVILQSVIVTTIVLCLISAWWYIFLYSYPKAYSEMIAERRRKVTNGLEDTFGLQRMTSEMDLAQLPLYEFAFGYSARQSCILSFQWLIQNSCIPILTDSSMLGLADAPWGMDCISFIDTIDCSFFPHAGRQSAAFRPFDGRDYMFNFALEQIPFILSIIVFRSASIDDTFFPSSQLVYSGDLQGVLSCKQTPSSLPTIAALQHTSRFPFGKHKASTFLKLKMIVRRLGIKQQLNCHTTVLEVCRAPGTGSHTLQVL